MPINHWLTPYMMEASPKAPPIPTAGGAAAAAGFWGSTASPAAVLCRHSQSTAFSLNLNNEDEEEAAAIAMDDGESNPNAAAAADLPKEPLFEKPLTPSDVGKLNRLVIPKQHAEKYFPLNGGGGGGGEKGLLLGFEDEVGKPWRFRYSYWNSSQSYVLTKGWSRFVKDKRLDAGDIVLFARHPNDVGRLFIGWRRRNVAGVPQPPCGGVGGGGGGWSGLLYTAHPYPSQTHDYSHAESHTRERSGNSKRLRLFGVNLEWDDEESEASCSGKASSQGQADEEPYHEHYSSHGRSSGHTVSYVCDSANI